nr:MPF2-like [Ipomoea batatas]
MEIEKHHHLPHFQKSHTRQSKKLEQENSLQVRLSKEISDKTRELSRIRGDDLEGLSLEELEELEQKLEVGLNRVSETKDEQIRNEIATLQYKGAELMEENNRLKQRVAEMNNDRNGSIVADMDRMILEEGQTSDQSITNNSTTQPPLQAADCSDTLLLKLGQISGEDLEGLSLEELEELEQKLEVGLNRVSETKNDQLRNEIATQGAELMEENNRLKQQVANDRQNGRIVGDMDRMILEEGQTSDQSITNNSTTQPPLQAANCSDTLLLKLG